MEELLNKLLKEMEELRKENKELKGRVKDLEDLHEDVLDDLGILENKIDNLRD